MYGDDMNALNEAIEQVGGAAALAKKLGVWPSAVTNWRSRGVPASQCPSIEEVSGVRCEQLRPDIMWIRGDDGRVAGHFVSANVMA